MITTEETSNTNNLWLRLQRRFTPKSNENPGSDDVPRHRGVAITMSILLSCLLWFSFTMTEEYSVVIDLPVQVENLPADEALSSLPPATVRVQFQGQGFQIFRLRYAPPSVRLNAALNRVALRDAIPELPKNVYIQSVSPEVVELRKEPRIVRRIPIFLRASVTTPPTHDLVRPPTIEPDSITVAGARSVVSRLRYWPTELARIRGLTDSLVTRVALSDTLKGLILYDTTGITLTAISKQFTEDRREIDVTLRGSPSIEQLVTLEPQTVTVRYRVVLDDYNSARYAPDFYAEVSYETLRSDTTGRVVPELHLPQDLIIRDVEVFPSSLKYYWRTGD